MNDTQYPTPPPGIKALPNGAGRSLETGQFVDPPGTYGPNTHPITKDNAAAMAKRKHQKTKDAIAGAIADTARTHGLKAIDAPEAVALAAAVLFGDVLDGKGSLWDRNRTLWDIAKRAGLIQDEAGTAAGRPSVNVQLSAEAIRELFKHTGGQVIDI